MYRAGDLSQKETIDNIIGQFNGDISILRSKILEKKMYFRVSVTSQCNLNCPFCHQEGSSSENTIDVSMFKLYASAANFVGFERVQFTGGEPFLHERIFDLFHTASNIFSDVGVTTNGTFIKKFHDKFMYSPLSNVHISLHEGFLNNYSSRQWRVPSEIIRFSDSLMKLGKKVRLNVPVPAGRWGLAYGLAHDANARGIPIKFFFVFNTQNNYVTSVIKESYASFFPNEEPIIAEIEATIPSVSIRRFSIPNGKRCNECSARDECREESRSLRLGADLVLRPCLASRAWDVPKNCTTVQEAMYLAACISTDW